MLHTTASISEISPNELFQEGYELADQTIIPNREISTFFIPEKNNVELFIYDANKELIDFTYGFNDWTITYNSSTTTLTSTDILQLNPEKDLIDRGYDVGILHAVYNFVNYELSSSYDNLYFISEISSDRTEIRLQSNFLSNDEITNSFNELKFKLENSDFFDEFYIASLENNYNIGVNVQLDTSKDPYSVLVKLYDNLPLTFSVKDEVYIATKVAETKAYKVEFKYDTPNLLDGDIEYLRGPNYNLEVKDFVNNSTNLLSKNDLLNTTSTSSQQNLNYVLNQQGVSISPDYTDFSDFINFSSAKKRLENFYEKVSDIESYENDLSLIRNITGSTTASFQFSESIASISTNIDNIIKNFDGFEYYLYYTTSSFAYPKSGSDFPYTLLSTGSTTVLNWLGSDDEGNAYYGGRLLSASKYDECNQNWLYYTIPEFLRSDSENDNYVDFSNMVGQHFDEIWLYTKAVTDKLNTTNELFKGVPLELAQEAIRSLGYEAPTNNYNLQDNYIGLIGEDNFRYVPPTGSEWITEYIAINDGGIENYWYLNLYSDPDYVEQLIKKGFPYPIDWVSKGIFKRLYHNMAYLVKKKGTVAGLRQLINIWGIPDTILRISEFGGKNKDNVDDYDLWYDRYSYALSTVAPGNTTASFSIGIPWAPLQRNTTAGEDETVPDAISFRFKTHGVPHPTYYSQSLIFKKANNQALNNYGDTTGDFGIGLFYTGSASGSYSGSSNSLYREWGIMNFFLSGSAAEGGTAVTSDIYLPFFNGDWWTVLIQRDQHVPTTNSGSDTNYTLYVKNKIYNGYDGNQIGFEGSSSFFVSGSESSSLNNSWNNWYSPIYEAAWTEDVLYLGGSHSGSSVGGYTLNNADKVFSGSFQEFRYYSHDLNETSFNDLVMNPESIEGNSVTGSESSFDLVNFRLPLGNELETISQIYTSASSNNPPTNIDSSSLTSYHPAVSATATSLITSSFRDDGWSPTPSNYNQAFIYYPYSSSYTASFMRINRETYYLDQPAMGIRNRITNKIQIPTGSIYGDVLSYNTSIQQNYQISRSYTEDTIDLEVAFSPQNEINDDIIQSLGYKNLSSIWGDPTTINSTSSYDYYPELRKIAEDHFKKYTQGNIYDYIRLIKYFDSSIFKAIKSYIPARTSLSTGIVIKQHLLERNRYRTPQATLVSTLAFASTSSQPLNYQDITLEAEIDVGEFEGGTGGVVEKYNYSGSASFGQYQITQSWPYTVQTISGSVGVTQSSQDEFYNGEYSGSCFEVEDGNLFDNPYLKDDLTPLLYDVFVVNASGSQPSWYQSGDGGFSYGQDVANFFNDISSSVQPGQAYLFVRQNLKEINFSSVSVPSFTDSGYPTALPCRTCEYESFNNISRISQDQSTPGFATDITGSYIEYLAFHILDKNGKDSRFVLQNDDLYNVRFDGINSAIGEGNPFFPTTINYNSDIVDIQRLTSSSSTIFENTVYDYREYYLPQSSSVIIKRVLPKELVRARGPGTVPSTGSIWYGNQFFSSSEDVIINFFPNVGDFENTPIFANSDYNAIPNNYNDNRDNSYLQDVDYTTNTYLPVNRIPIINNTADKIQTPDSNYTMRRHTYPRYEGSRLQSLDYNKYNASLTTASFLTDKYSTGVAKFYSTSTGSYSGDKSYGKTSTIEINPLYFAHFVGTDINTSSVGDLGHQPPLNDQGNDGLPYAVFRLDALIECPTEDIQGEDINPKIIEVDGSNNNLYEVVNSFQKGREMQIIYKPSGSGLNSIYDNASKPHKVTSSIVIPGHHFPLDSNPEGADRDDRIVAFIQKVQVAGNASPADNAFSTVGGYLIPEDFSPIQKKNVKYLITQLKEKNAFRDDST